MTRITLNCTLSFRKPFQLGLIQSLTKLHFTSAMRLSLITAKSLSIRSHILNQFLSSLACRMLTLLSKLSFFSVLIMSVMRFQLLITCCIVQCSDVFCIWPSGLGQVFFSQSLSCRVLFQSLSRLTGPQQSGCCSISAAPLTLCCGTGGGKLMITSCGAMWTRIGRGKLKPAGPLHAVSLCSTGRQWGGSPSGSRSSQCLRRKPSTLLSLRWCRS